MRQIVTVLLFSALGLPASGQSTALGQTVDDADPRALPPGGLDFFNWESPHVHPMDMTPDGQFLLVVNTPDNRLEVFGLSSGDPVWEASIAVGLDPVSVRARSNREAWVVNHVSDSVSVVDLAGERVRATLATEDEPADVVFAGQGRRAFVSCSQANRLLAFDPEDLGAPPERIDIRGEDPRALAVSPDGKQVYVAIFESGNSSTILGGGIEMGVLNTLAYPPNVVGEEAGPWGGVNPPPNSGAGFHPPLSAGLPAPPAVGLIVKQDDQGRWMDDNGGDWTAFVSGDQAAMSGRREGWSLADHDLAIYDTRDGSVRYVRRLMNLCMALSVNPVSGRLYLVGTEALNEVRFEPVLNGRFLRVQLAVVSADPERTSVVTDLNGHLDYAEPTVSAEARQLSLGDPRGIDWNAAGTKAFVSGMGSNNLVVIDEQGARTGLRGTIEVGEGPTGVQVDDERGRVYVLNRFGSSLSVVDLETELESSRVPFFDPSPPALRIGRRHLYDTHATSGLGHVSCASCHVDARMDRIGWDLGNPEGEMKSVAGQNLGMGFPGLTTDFEDFHPMKGPMVTQTLQDIIGKEPHHWRGDRDGIEEFNGAFTGLLGDDAPLTAEQMQEFEDYLATIYFPPNPFRTLRNALSNDLPLPGHFATGRFAPAGTPLPNGNAVRGARIYQPPRLFDGGLLSCFTCHTMPTGMGTGLRWQGGRYREIAAGPLGERHHGLVSQDGSTNVSMKIPQLRNLYEKVGFDATQDANLAGFGFLHDGSVDSLARFVSEPAFELRTVNDVADLVALMLSFSGSDLPDGSDRDLIRPPGTASQDTHAAVGRQLTLSDEPTPEEASFLAEIFRQADVFRIGLVARGTVGGESRGFAYDGAGRFRSDRETERYRWAELRSAAVPGQELTLTVVPWGTQQRIGLDRDRDGFWDRDELDRGWDPADPESPSPEQARESARTVLGVGPR